MASRHADPPQWTQLPLVSCLAVALAFIAFAFGAVNMLDLDLDRQIDGAEQAARELSRTIDERRVVPVDKIFGGGSGQDRQWVECVDGAVILQPEATRITLEALRQRSPAFIRAARQKGHVVFLIRPDGYESFRGALPLVPQGVTVGYEPVDAQWPLKF